MSKAKRSTPVLWKDMKRPVSLEVYADELTQKMADQEMDISHLGEKPGARFSAT